MKIRLYSKPDKGINPKAMVALNRGIPAKKIQSFFMNKEQDINSSIAFGEELLKEGAKLILKNIQLNKKAIVIVDSDVDGWTSSATLINYLYESFPGWVTNNVSWWLHEGKQHGLNDLIDNILDCEPGLIICPDSATNDVEAIERLHNIDCDVLILDHHLSDVPFSPYAVTINSQYAYPNNQLSGVGVVYQFCRYLDSIMNKNNADNYLDLVAVGLMGDMMDMRSLETKELMFKGFQDEYMRNPLIEGLARKAEFALSKPDYAPSKDNNLGITPMGAAFFIIPLLNALSRSGTMEEKTLVFESMLTCRAFDEIFSNKRGHKAGEKERRVDQALRTCTNVKNRQTRAEEAGMELLTSRANKMLDDKVLVFPLDGEEVDPNITGLVANKLMAKYQRPVCVIRNIGDSYAGSMRGYTATGIDDFKAVAETSPSVEWVRGHENAAGICVSDIAGFRNDMNRILKDVSTEIMHYVDYTWSADNIDNQAIIDLSEMNDYIGTGFARPLVHVYDCTIYDYMIMKDVHLKINLPDRCSAIMWNAPEDFLDRLRNGEKPTIEFVAKCNTNEWNCMKNPQLIIEDWEETEIIYNETDTMAAWGF